MGITGPVRPVTAPPLPGGGGSRAGRAAGGPAAGLAILHAAVRAPFTGRARREVLFCLSGLPFVLVNPVTVFQVTAVLLWLFWRPTPARPPNLSWRDVAAAGTVVGLVLLLLVATGAARGIGAACRRLAARLLGERIPAPPPLPPRPRLLRGPDPQPRDPPRSRAR